MLLYRSPGENGWKEGIGDRMTKMASSEKRVRITKQGGGGVLSTSFEVKKQ